jgi:hypothetical protein
VDEINEASIGNAFEQRTIRFHHFELIPADLWNFQAAILREANDLAWKYSQPGGATVELLALLEQRLVADTNAEEWPSGPDEFARGFQQFLFSALIQSSNAPTPGSTITCESFMPSGSPGRAVVRADLQQRSLWTLGRPLA